VVVVAGLAVALTGCGGKSSGSSGSGSNAASAGTSLSAFDFRFQPTTLPVKAGQSVTFQFKNEGKVEHNFSLSEASVDKDLEPGKTVTVTFTAPSSAGTYQFFCKYHKASSNMVGTLAVT
jgi:plastocyanin